MTSPKRKNKIIIGLAALGLAASMSFGASAEPIGQPEFAVHKVSHGKIRAGVAAFNKGDFAKSAFFQRSALSEKLSKSRKIAAYENLCAAEAAMGNLEAANTACAQALDINANSWQALNNRGIVNWLSGEKAAATADFAASAQAGGAAIVTANANLLSQETLASAN